jgi:hypothetical protein
LTLRPDDGIVVSRSERQWIVDASQYPSALRERLGDNGSAALAEVLTDHEEHVVMLVSSQFERRLTQECGQLRGEMSTLRAELRSDFKVGLAQLRADLLKWSFLFWVGQSMTVVGLILAMR